jgi:hypothetical protein
MHGVPIVGKEVSEASRARLRTLLSEQLVERPSALARP